MTNRELAILGYAIQALLKLNAVDDVKKISDMMQGLDKPSEEKE